MSETDPSARSLPLPYCNRTLAPGARFRLARFMASIKAIEEQCAWYLFLYEEGYLGNLQLEDFVESIGDVLAAAEMHADVFAQHMRTPPKKVTAVDSHEEADRILAETLRSYRLRSGSK